MTTEGLTERLRDISGQLEDRNTAMREIVVQNALHEAADALDNAAILRRAAEIVTQSMNPDGLEDMSPFLTAQVFLFWLADRIEGASGDG